MNSTQRVADWRSILLLIFALSMVLLTLSAAIGILIFMAVNRSSLSELNASPLTSVLTATTLLAMGLLLIPVAWLSMKRLRGEDFGTFVLPRVRVWEWIAIPVIWLLGLTLATLFYNAPGAVWYIPFLHFFSIALPLYFVLRLAVSRISLGSIQRVWGVFGVGMTIGPLLAIFFELCLIALGVLVVAVYLGFDPASMTEIERLISQIERTPDLDSLLIQLGPLLKSPLTLLAGLAFLSFLVPIIEETTKSLGVWFVADRLQFPAQGFALGALSGAGFALAESLSASLTPDDSWALTLGMRAVSGSMHMLASGLLGLGIAYARLEKRYFRLAGMTLLAMLLHAVWNAGAVLSVWGGARVMLAMPGFDFVGSVAALSGMGLLFFLIAGMFVTFFILNERLRAASPPPPPAAPAD
jgi:RsiW-degrading membrane proteinase PrsW (M82 family)